MGCYPELDSHIRDKVKVVLDLLNYATKNNLNMVQEFIHLILLLKKISFLSKPKLTN